MALVPLTPGMAQALDAVAARQGSPTDDDRPPASTFPMTKAASAALRETRRRDQAASR